MKKLIISLLLFPIMVAAQSSLFVGIQGGINSTTLLNKEDKSAPKGMLNKKNGIQPGFGFQIGYRIKQRFELSIEPNYQPYTISYSGSSDTANVRSFDATLRMRYYQIPLVLTYKHPINERLSVLVGIGASYNYLGYYKEEFKGVKTQSSFPMLTYSQYYYIENKKGYSESAEINDSKVDIAYSSTIFNPSSYSLVSRVGVSYFLSYHLALDVKFQYIRALSEIENRDIIYTNGIYRESGFVSNQSGKYWTESKYYRYYNRNYQTTAERVGSFTQAIGIGIGLHYYISGTRNKN